MGRPSITLAQLKSHITANNLPFRITAFEMPVHSKSRLTVRYHCGHESETKSGYVLYKKLECRTCNPVFYSHARFQARIHQTDPHISLLEFSGVRKRAKFECTLDGHIWSTVAMDFHGCRKCADRHLRQPFESYLKLLKNSSTECLSPEEDYDGVGRSTLTFRCKKCEHIWKTSSRSAKQHNFSCPECAKVRFSLNRTKKHSEFVKELHKKHARLRVIGRYLGANKPIRMQCTKCKHEWNPVPSSLLYGTGCPSCAKQYSKVSIEWLEACARALRLRIRHFENAGEFKIPETRFRADGYNARNKLIFEFLGDFWHGNPKVFSSASAKEKYDKTIDRVNSLLSLGYTVVYTWERDFYANVSYKVLAPASVTNHRLISNASSYKIKQRIRSL